MDLEATIGLKAGAREPDTVTGLRLGRRDAEDRYAVVRNRWWRGRAALLLRPGGGLCRRREHACQQEGQQDEREPPHICSWNRFRAPQSMRRGRHSTPLYTLTQ